MWANAIDLALKIPPWQLQFSVNYPNYADITNLPEIASWLISNVAREQFMKDMDVSFLKDNSLNSNDNDSNIQRFCYTISIEPC